MSPTILKEYALAIHEWPESPNKRIVENLLQHIKDQEYLIHDLQKSVDGLEMEISDMGDLRRS